MRRAPDDDEQGADGVARSLPGEGAHRAAQVRGRQDSDPSRSAKPSRDDQPWTVTRDAGSGDQAAGDKPAGAPPARRWLREVADRTDDVEPAHPQARTDDGRERDDEADGKGLRQALRPQREEQVEAVVLGREDPGGERHEHGPEADSRRNPERGCHSSVDPAFGCECADELGASHADGAGHPELCLALCCEHDEEVHEQQQAGEHPEAAHRGEHRCESLPTASATSSVVLLTG